MNIFSIQQMAKAIVLFSGFFLIETLANAQNITGQWHGALNIQGIQLRIVFNIGKSNSGYTSTMDSPDQGAKDIPVTTTSFDGDQLSLAMPPIGLTYEGKFNTDSIVGTLKQHGVSYSMTLKRTPQEPKPIARPQEPKPPYPYRSEDISFENRAAGITLSGTLTMPTTGSKFAAVVLISGSGAQDRNEQIMGHKPFLVIADYLTRRGIAVLRYDDRGTAASTGNFHLATTADFATDAESAIAWLKTRKEMDPQRIGLVGHSEGGVIAPMVAARSEEVAFVVMLAGTAIRGDSLLLLQQRLIARAMGASEDNIRVASDFNRKLVEAVREQADTADLKKTLDGIIRKFVDLIPNAQAKAAYDETFIKTVVERLSTPWMLYFLRYDPAPVFERVTCRVLAVNGSKDLQVPANVNLPTIRKALEKGGNQKVTIKEYPGLNHLFQECTTGAPNEYASIEQTFSPEVLKDLADWILK